MLRNDNYFLIFTKIIIWLLSYFLNHQTKLLCILNLGLLGLTNSSKRKTEDHTDYIKNGRSFKHIRLLVLHMSRLLTIQWFFSRLFLTFLQKHEKYTLTVDNHFTLPSKILLLPQMTPVSSRVKLWPQFPVFCVLTSTPTSGTNSSSNNLHLAINRTITVLWLE